MLLRINSCTGITGFLHSTICLLLCLVSQAGIKIAGRNNNLRYADDTTLMAESEEGLKNLIMRVKEESTKMV